MLEGCALGELLVEGQKGAYFNYAYEPIYFFASDTGEVKLRIGLIQEGGIATKSVADNSGIFDKSSIPLKKDLNKKTTVIKTDTSMALNKVNTCFGGNIGALVYEDLNFEISNVKIEVELPSEILIAGNPQITILSDIKVKLKNYSGPVTYKFQIPKLEWVARGNVQTTQGYAENIEGIYSEDASQPTNLYVDEWYDPLRNVPGVIRGGDKTELFIQALFGSSILTKTVKDFKIIGCNPTNQEFKNEITRLIGSQYSQMMQVIVYNESRFHHFSPGPGYPLQGLDPRDFGICQITLAYSDLTDIEFDNLIWDWKANLTEGVRLFNEKKGWQKIIIGILGKVYTTVKVNRIIP